jgi:hypothetical protein
MLDGSSNALVKSVRELNASLEGELNPALLTDENGKLVFDDSITIERAMLMVRLMQNRIIGRGLPPFLDLYVPAFWSGPERVLKKDRAKASKVACDEKHLQTVLYVARHSGEDLSLVDVTGNVYDKTRAQHNSYRKRIKLSVIPHLAKVGIWDCTQHDDDTWTIKSGATLDAFVTHVFTPWAVRQGKFFGNFLKERGEE